LVDECSNTTEIGFEINKINSKNIEESKKLNVEESKKHKIEESKKYKIVEGITIF